MLILILCCACRCLYSSIPGNISIFGKNCTETYHTWLSGKVDIKARGRDLDKYETFSKNQWRGISTNIKFLQFFFGFLNQFLFSTDKQANTNNLQLLRRSPDHHRLISIPIPQRLHEKKMCSEEKLSINDVVAKSVELDLLKSYQVAEPKLQRISDFIAMDFRLWT